MTSMDQIHRIRDLCYGQDKSPSEIARIEDLDRRTVRKYADMEGFNEAPPGPDEEQHSSKLDPFKPIIDNWLTEDKKAPQKQRHTAKRVHKRLKDEVDGYDCSYHLVAAYVAGKKKELRLKKLNRQHSVFPSDTALLKALFLSTFEATKNGLCRYATGDRSMVN